ncbi:hypothetical protein JW766_02845 [Candidatus Dojkabacteria bacterium]|nr:hypothetical protein [Candidatus Dojkabacteria bacterium]
MKVLLDRLKMLCDNKIILIVFILIQLVLLYGLTYWGYHSSRLPYWFDNFVHETRVWRIYGRKDYSVRPVSPETWLDPRLGFLKKSFCVQEINGFLRGKEVVSEEKEYWYIESSDHPEVKIEVNKPVGEVFLKDCRDTEDCSKVQEVSGNIDEVEVGDALIILQEESYEEEHTIKTGTIRIIKY